MPAPPPVLLIFNNSSTEEESEESIPLPPPFNEFPGQEGAVSGEGESLPVNPSINAGEDTPSSQRPESIYISQAELPLLAASVAVALAALGLSLWFLGRSGFFTLLGSGGLLSRRKEADPYLPPPRVLPRSAHERIQDPKYLRGILEEERRSGRASTDGTRSGKESGDRPRSRG